MLLACFPDHREHATLQSAVPSLNMFRKLCIPSAGRVGRTTTHCRNMRGRQSRVACSRWSGKHARRGTRCAIEPFAMHVRPRPRPSRSRRFGGATQACPLRWSEGAKSLSAQGRTPVRASPHGVIREVPEHIIKLSTYTPCGRGTARGLRAPQPAAAELVDRRTSRTCMDRGESDVG